MAILHKSKFFRADSRRHLPGGGGTHSTLCDAGILVNYISLQPGSSSRVHLPKHSLNIVFPIAGGMILTGTHTGGIALHPEELYCHCGAQDEEVSVQNPSEERAVNLLHISLEPKSHSVEMFATDISKLRVSEKNRMMQGEGLADCIKVGVYDSRVKGQARLSPGRRAVFAYVINGSFGLEERRMEYRDGLFLWDKDETEFEASSEASTVLLIECPFFN